MDVKNKKIVVVGLARSGLGAANLLSKLGASVTVTDKKSPQELKDYIGKLDTNIKLKLGDHPLELFQNADLIITSPGVPLDVAPLKAASDKGIKVIGELELAYQIISNQQSAVSATPIMPLGSKFLAITGTNGKSTTTTLLYEMMKNGGFNAILGGNIGNALTEEIQKVISSYKSSAISYIVAEVSSFQLDSIDKFRPKVSAILNITPDHLNRYHCMAKYIDSKCRIFLNQTNEDFLVLNADDPTTKIIENEKLKIKSQRPSVFYFSRQKEIKGAYYRDGIIYFNIPELNLHPSTFSLQPSTFKIKGVHNIENAMAASLMALLSGCSMGAIVNTMSTFSGLEHRLEFVREIDGVRFINDSKGTNVGAVVKSLESFSEPVILIAGGSDKDSDFTTLKPLIKERVKALILIGEAKDKIQKAVADSAKEVYIEKDLKGAVLKGKQIAEAGDVVLLSPACASFDMFRDFEDRGRQFKKAVMEI